MDVRNKVAIVIGASSGIGKATAILLSKNDAKVVLASRSLQKLKDLEKELPNSLAIKTDMTDESQVKELILKTIKHFGRVDILVNNAATGYDAYIEEIDMDKFRKLFALNLVGPLVAIQNVIPYMKKNRGGVIVNISSGTSLMCLPGMGAYSSLKRALTGISLTAGEELKDFGIAVSLVYPYITSTDFEKNTLKESLTRKWDGPPLRGDPPEYVARKILEAIKTGKREIFAHEFMTPK